jgi:hypothetical protein
MKIVKLKGGLGNQLFQYAFAKLIEQLSQEEVKIDTSYFNGTIDDRIRKPRIYRYNISISTASKFDIAQVCKFVHEGNPLSLRYKVGIVAEKCFNSHYYFENTRSYRELEKIFKFSYFDGYWQSWKYVDLIWDKLYADLSLDTKLSEKTISTINQVKSQNSVFIGIRKGDYSSEVKHYGSYSQDYYNRAIQYILNRVDDPIFYIFSNDIAWVKKNMSFNRWHVVYREDSDIVDDFEELQIMACCKHSIIANSTYHWWGARINDNDEKIVIAPKTWFFDNKPIDIITPRWITIEND